MIKKNTQVADIAVVASQKEKERNYWMERLAWEPALSHFPHDRDIIMPGHREEEREEFVFSLTGRVHEGLMKLSNRSPHTLHLILVTNLVLLLKRFSGNNDMVVGTPIYKQQGGGGEVDFINTMLPLRFEVKEGQSVKELLLAVRQAVTEGAEHQNFPIGVVGEQLGFTVESGGCKLFDTAILVEPIHDAGYIRPSLPGMLFSFRVGDGAAVEGAIEYDNSKYRPDTIQRLATYFAQQAEALVGGLDLPAVSINCMSEEETRQVVEGFNDTRREYPSEGLIHDLFRCQAEERADEIALVGHTINMLKESAVEPGRLEVTYGQLDERSDFLAGLLKEKGVRPDTIIAIWAPRSVEVIVADLAVLKAGGAFMPIDPEYPDARVRYMLGDSNTSILLTTPELAEGITFDKEILYIDTLFQDGEPISQTNNGSVSPEHTQSSKAAHIGGPGGAAPWCPPHRRPRRAPGGPPEAEGLSSSSLAYVIYTSGSTGIPKGVMVDHRNVVRLVRNATYADFGSDMRILQTGAPVFDATTFEIWGPLLNGGRLYLVPKDVILDAGKLRPALEADGITTLWISSPLFNQLIRQDGSVFKTSRLNYIITGGEVISPSVMNQARASSSILRVNNAYGPTENTTFSTTFPITRDYETPIPIGKSITNSTTYILDGNCVPQPIGALGLLWVGGEGVARGYMNSPEMTAEKFIPDPFLPATSSVYPPRMYNSGDIARWLPDGNLDFIGRDDNQVKVRGFRVEPGEIENRLLQHGGINAALVMKRTDDTGNEHLCAYITIGGIEPGTQALREYLSETLPDHMIPSHFITLDKFPLNPNGKVDRKALAQLEISDLQAREEYVAPRDELEKQLVEIWAYVLDLDKGLIGIDAVFFEIGGHSLNAMLLISKIHQATDVKVSLKEIFVTPTIRELADYIRGASKEDYIAIEAVPRQEFYDASSAQKRVWVSCMDEKASLSFNISTTYHFDEPIDAAVLERSFEALIQRHESLRTVFILVDGIVKQKILEPGSIGFSLQRVDLRGAEDAADAAGTMARLKEMSDREMVTPFDLERGPLLRATLVHLDDNRSWILFVMHHIISDYWSLRVLLDEALALYRAYALGNENPLEPLTIQYKDYTAWQNKLLTDENLRKHRDYWLNRFKTQPSLLDLPLDRERSVNTGYDGEVASFFIQGDLKSRLKAIGDGEGATLFMTLLAAVNILLYRYTGEKDIVVGTPIAGREHADLENQIGFYLNMLPLRTRLETEDTFIDLLDRIKTVTLGAYEHQVYPFDSLVDDLGIKRDIKRNPIFDVVVDMVDLGSRESQVDSAVSSSEEEFSIERTGSKFDLTLYFFEDKNALNIKFEYKTDLFDRETIFRMARRFRMLLETIAQKADAPISRLPLEPSLEFPPLQGASVPAMPMHMGVPTTIPASFHQERLWFIDSFEAGNLYEGAPIYHNIPLILDLKGEVDAERLEQALGEVVNRHEALRTQMVMVDDKPFQSILYAAQVELERREPVEDGWDYDTALKTVIQETRLPFVLEGDLLVRALWVPVEDNRSLLGLTLHHIVADRYSLDIILRDLMACYNASATGAMADLPELSLHYADFSQWQREFPSDFQEQLMFHWKEMLRGRIQALELPTDSPRVAIHIYSEAHHPFEISGALYDRVGQFCQRENIEPSLLLMGTFKLLLHKYCRQEEVVIGTSVHNRRQENLENVVGPIANLIVLRSFIEENRDGLTFLNQLGATVEEAKEYGCMPFDRLVTLLNPTKDMSRTALFDVLFQYEDKPLANDGNDAGLQVNVVETNFGWGKYDFNLLLKKEDHSFAGHMVYNGDYYEAGTIERFTRHYLLLLESLCRQPGLPVSDIAILSEEEKQLLLYDFNQTDASYPGEATLHSLFHAQVEKRPDGIALKIDFLHLTYRELNRRANRVAVRLRELAVGPDVIVGLVLPRSLEMLVGMIGILKAGGAYMPIDPEYPDDRIQFMLQDSETKVLLTTRELESKAGMGFTPIYLEEEILYLGGADTEENQTDGNPENINSPDDMAYIIYTSGTTGKPKGTIIEHRNVVRLMTNDLFPFDFNQKDVWTMFHSYCFDFSVWEMYGALLYGGKLIVIPRMTARSPEDYLALLKREGVTVLNQTPPAFYNLIDAEMKDIFSHLSLKYIIFGGEALKPSKLKEWNEKYPQTKLINMFGITETTVHVTVKEITQKEIETNTSNIGVPIPTLKTYVMDHKLQLMPIGIAGEMCVGGLGVCRGYLNRKELTEEKFIDNPYNPGERLYRSGDLVKVLANGEMVYLGRIDHQVKIRGFRIELGEIENQLLAHPDINEAVVLSREDNAGENYLCAYLVPPDGMALDSLPDITQLRDHLSGGLPDYMIPSYFVPLLEIPLTSNGKVDRKKLPLPVIDAADGYIPPSNNIEKKLVEIWAEILDVDPGVIGLDSNFFELGGHSLKATLSISQIYKELNVKVELPDMFQNPTIRGIAALVSSGSRDVAAMDRYASIEAVEKKEYYAMSSAQKRLFILQQMDLSSLNYNVTMVETLGGSIDKEKLEDAFKLLIQRHESLRTSFQLIDGSPVQQVAETVPFQIEYHDLREAGDTDSSSDTGEMASPADDDKMQIKISRILRDFVRPFDLGQAPLLRIGLIRTADDSQILAVDMHHIISDGISIDITTKEFTTLYGGGQLPELRLHYKDFSQWQNDDTQQSAIKQQEEYWLNQFQGELPLFQLPTDFVRPPMQNFEGDKFSFEISAQDTEALRQLIKTQDVTLFMALLAAFNVMLSKLSGLEDIVVGTSTAGRRHADLENIIGMFVNTLALRNQPEGSKTFSQFLAEIKDNTLKAFEYQDYPFEDLVENVDVTRDMKHNPLFDVMFVLQNFGDTAPAGSGAEPPADLPRQQGVTRTAYAYESKLSIFDLTLTAVETRDNIHCTFAYRTRLFKSETIERFSGYLKRIISNALGAPNMEIARIPLMSQEEQHRLSVQFNRLDADDSVDFSFPEPTTMHQLFREQAQKTPEQAALIFKNSKVSYRDLDEQSDLLAKVLISKGVKPGTIAALMVTRSIEMIVAMFGILKAGGAYLPIDPDSPTDRIDYMLTDSNAALLLTPHKEVVEKLTFNGDVLYPDALQDDLARLSPGDLPYGAEPEDPAYIIYTSGTTGRPKGVIVAHENAVNTLRVRRDEYQLGTGAVALQLFPYVFDGFITSFFTPIVSGSSVVLVGEDDLKDMNKIREAIVVNKVTHFISVPSLYRAILDNLSAENLESVQVVTLAGEALPADLLDKTREKNENLEIAHEYGVTEAAVMSTILRNQEQKERISIGAPIKNTAVYILDRYDQLQLTGVPGELCVGGPGVARGYLNKPEMTAEKFLLQPPGKPFEGPFPGMGPSFLLPIYKTGDLARWLPDGTIEFLGRIDTQVKIRGFRIELGEIENRLAAHEHIKEAVVTVKNQNLCAYIVPLSPPEAAAAAEDASVEDTLTVTHLRTYLSAHLPDYMIPADFIRIEAIPLTSRGKIDKKALDSMGAVLESGVKYAAPETEMEKTVAAVWEEILERENIGIHDKFFDIGGTSLDVIKVSTKLKEVLNRDVPVIAMFEHLTIQSFALYLTQEPSQTTQLKDRTQKLDKGKSKLKQRGKRRKNM